MSFIEKSQKKGGSKVKIAASGDRNLIIRIRNTGNSTKCRAVKECFSLVNRVLVSSNLTRPRGLALDAEEGLLYWTDQVIHDYLFMVQDIFIIVLVLLFVVLRIREGFSGIADPVFPLDPGSKGLKGTGDPGSAAKNVIIFNPKFCY